jgi:hypothetical protein
MRQHKSAVLHVAAIVHEIRISYQITQNVSDVTSSDRIQNITSACDASGGIDAGCCRLSHRRQPPLLSHDNAAHHTRNDAIDPNPFLPCVNVHTGRRGDKSVSCEDDTASQEAPQQLRRERELHESGQIMSGQPLEERALMLEIERETDEKAQARGVTQDA